MNPSGAYRALIMDSMTTGPNTEVWCKSKKVVNMTALKNTEAIETVSCKPQHLHLQMLDLGTGGPIVVYSLELTDILQFYTTLLCG
jgi:hypothetical protein